MATVLAKATDDEIKDYQRRLKDIRNRTSSDLQKNVFVNRTQFVVISKEIDKLKSEMRVLRTLLTELHNTTDSLRTESTFGNTTDSDRPPQLDRKSVV